MSDPQLGDPTKSRRGKAYKARSDNDYKCFEAHDGVLYRPGDHVFLEVSQCEPYYIGTIANFKMTKRDQMSVKVTRFYRPEDVPEDSYSLLLQDRQDDTSLNHAVMAAMQIRELFSSEIASVHPICHLRSSSFPFLFTPILFICKFYQFFRFFSRFSNASLSFSLYRRAEI
ncbi:unnamed protein product [Gongylonema pulchrum]|uniref:BAH domain-containing protein n=1 Tax=Gongylonema pulchrum TaxID=637853 RepID=A0A183E779_9BILA|nr:unnamed protein product [Gongylonema pulchrum]